MQIETHLVDRQRVVRGVVHSVPDHLTVRFLRLIPVYHSRCGTQHSTYDLQRKCQINDQNLT